MKNLRIKDLLEKVNYISSELNNEIKKEIASSLDLGSDLDSFFKSPEAEVFVSSISYIILNKAANHLEKTQNFDSGGYQGVINTGSFEERDNIIFFKSVLFNLLANLGVELLNFRKGDGTQIQFTLGMYNVN